MRQKDFKNFRGSILVLYGDHPLVSAKTIRQLLSSHEKNTAKVTLMTAKIKDFKSWRAGFSQFGRILRDEKGNVCGIRELKDCSGAEKEIKEINPSYFCFDSQWLWKNIGQLKTDNNQKEYYLTDLIKIAFAQKEKIDSIEINPVECLGVNNIDQLKVVERILNKINFYY